MKRCLIGLLAALSLPVSLAAQGIDLTTEADGTPAATGGEAAGPTALSLQETLQLFAMWVQDYWVPLLLSPALFYLGAVALTYFWGLVARVRPIIAPPLGLLCAMVVWVGAIVYLYVLRSPMFSSGIPWPFLVLIGGIGVVLLIIPLASLHRRRAA
jgi:hypothetical protein